MVQPASNSTELEGGRRHVGQAEPVGGGQRKSVNAKTSMRHTQCPKWITFEVMGQAVNAAFTLWPCIFGCESLTHYLECDPLWTLCVSHTGLGIDALSLPSPHRLCLTNPSPSSLRLCGIACWLYHTLKLDKLDEHIDACDFDAICSLANDVLQVCPLCEKGIGDIDSG